MDYSALQIQSVLGAKNRIACVADKNYQAGLAGESVDKCCIRDVLFTYGLLLDVQCYEIGGENNCWTEAQFLQGVQLLDSLLT